MNKSKDDVMSTPHPSQSLWEFALAYYAQPQVAETCLQLQDEYQVNVCLLIGLRWLDTRGQGLDNTQLSTLVDYVQSWTEKVVLPLRLLRRSLKLPFDHFAQDEEQHQLRSVVKQAELLAEKKLLIEIERWAGSHIKNAQGSDNLERYLIQMDSPDYLRDLLVRQ